MDSLPSELMKKIIDCTAQLGWQIVINNSDQEIQGFIIGTEEYVESVFDHLPENWRERQ